MGQNNFTNFILESLKDTNTQINENEANYTVSEMLDILSDIKAGKYKAVLLNIKNKDNVTLLDVVKTLIEKGQAKLIPRLIEMGVQSGYIKI